MCVCRASAAPNQPSSSASSRARWLMSCDAMAFFHGTLRSPHDGCIITHTPTHQPSNNDRATCVCVTVCIHCVSEPIGSSGQDGASERSTHKMTTWLPFCWLICQGGGGERDLRFFPTTPLTPPRLRKVREEKRGASFTRDKVPGSRRLPSRLGRRLLTISYACVNHVRLGVCFVRWRRKGGRWPGDDVMRTCHDLKLIRWFNDALIVR